MKRYRAGEPKQLDPHDECLSDLLQAVIALRNAQRIAEVGTLYAEIKDAAGIVAQSITFLLAARARDHAAAGTRRERDRELATAP